MTFDQFAPPFLLLEMHFEQRPRADDEEELFQRSWFRLFENISVEAWQAAVDRWVATQKWMPKPVEIRELCYEEATRLVHEREEAQRRARLEAKPPIDPVALEDLKARMRGLKDALQGPQAAGFHPQLPDYGVDDER